jgi:hypothetical protein
METLALTEPHALVLAPLRESVSAFAAKPDTSVSPAFAELQAACATHGGNSRNRDAAVDLSASTDPR